MPNKKGNITYTEDTRLALLEHTIIDINKTLERFEKRFDRIDERFDRVDERFNKLDEKFERMNEKMDSHFRTSVYMIIGLYGGVIATLVAAVGKAYHWF